MASILLYVSIGTAILAIVAWLALEFLVPDLLAAAYQGRSIAIVNSLIKGQRDHPVGEYMLALSRFKHTVMLALLSLATVCFLLGLGIRLQLDRLSSQKLNWIVFFAMLILIASRDATLFTHPRFWAEEVTVYFYTAYSRPLEEALFAPHQGYYSLFANLGGILANLPPLEYAPLATTIMAALVPTAIVAAIIVNDSFTLNATLKKAVASIAIVTVGASGDIWLTTINSQHYIPVLVFLILIDSKSNPLKRRGWYIATAFAGLSSIAANFLTPLFLLRYRQRRERADLVLFFILFATSIVQLIAIIYSLLVLREQAYYHSSQIRQISNFDFISVLSQMGYYLAVYPLFDHHRAVGYFGAIILLYLLYATRAKVPDQWIFFGAVCLLTFLSVIASLDMRGGPRYAYSASVILMLALLNLSSSYNVGRPARLAAGSLLLVSILYWSLNFRNGLEGFRDKDWPLWSDEVRAWRLDPTRKLQAHPVWPLQTAQGLVWSIELNPR